MSKCILVVEDNEDNRQILRVLLRKSGFEMIEAHDGEAALTIAAAKRPDLILMDVQLPGIDGYEAMRRLKDQGISTQADVDAADAGADSLKARLELGRQDVAVAERQVELDHQPLLRTGIMPGRSSGRPSCMRPSRVASSSRYAGVLWLQ